MTFDEFLVLGENGWPASKLKDAPDMEENEAFALYLKLVVYMRTMFVKCKLIHADLSEFNLLIDSKQNLYVIDVSQSVEHAHPNALEFLRMDCRNVNDFFSKRFALKNVLTVQQLFSFITDPTINESNEKIYLDKLIEQRIESIDDESKLNEIDERVFQKIFLPQSLDDVPENSKKNLGEISIVLGMNRSMTGARLVPEILDEKEQSASLSSDDDDCSSSCSSSTSSSDDDDDDDQNQEQKESDDQQVTELANKLNNVRPRDESPNSKRLRKHAVREQKREKRKTKIPKHVKKRAEKLGGDKRRKK